MQFFWRLAPLYLVVALAGCGGSEPQVFESLARPVNNLQCEPVRETPLQLDAELAAAGIAVRTASCAWDGMAYTASCGSPATFLRVIEIPQDQVATAKALGYQQPSQFDAFIPIDCPTF